MRISLNTVKQLTEVDLAVDELVAKINQQLGGVEEVIDLGERYKDARIVRVVECYKHPNADKLSVCKIDAGDNPLYTNYYLPSTNLVQVVCGAPNARAGMLAVWLPPKSTVPSSYSDKELFVLDSRELRGEISHGMLASARELALGDDHNGIVEVTEADLAPGSKFETLNPGQKFAEIFGLDDTIIDIENKMFTHRPDLFGQLGVAREIAGIQHKKFVSPDWYQNPELGSWQIEDSSLELEVFNDASDKVPRFMTVAIKDVSVRQSPLWLRAELVRLGGKPINNIVDVTNFIMLLTAQPVHAYDYDKIHGGKLGARMAASGETVKLLNGKTYQLTTDDIVIADGDGPVGLAGIMGGGESEVSHETKDIVLEVANFDMYTIRRSSMHHGVFTDALTRFNKGQSPRQNPVVLNQLMQAVYHIAGGSQASPVFDPEAVALPEKPGSYIDVEFINSRLGLYLTKDEIADLLENVEFEICRDCQKPGGEDRPQIKYTVPFWRTDINIAEDIVEEVGRLYGYDRLPRQLPKRSIKPAGVNLARLAKQKIRDSLARAGANEALTYSFVHENVLNKSQQDPAEAFELSNALSPDLQYYRLTVLPSLLDKVHGNIKSGHDEFVLFEIGKGHNKKYHASDDEGNLPSEMMFVDMVYASKKPRPGAAFYQIRRYVDQLMKDLGQAIVCLPADESHQYPVTAPFDLSRSAMVYTADSNEFIGLVGELKASVIKSFKLPTYSAAATLDFGAIEKIVSENSQNYQPISRYPSVSQDVSLGVKADQHYADLYDLAHQTLEHDLNDDFTWSLEPVAIYQGDDKSVKAITLRLEVASYQETLNDQQVQDLIGKVVAKASEVYGAKQK